MAIEGFLKNRDFFFFPEIEVMFFVIVSLA